MPTAYSRDPIGSKLKGALWLDGPTPEIAKRLVDDALVAWARNQGCAVNTWTVNDPSEARRLAELGVDVVITDVPDQLIEALHRKPE